MGKKKGKRLNSLDEGMFDSYDDGGYDDGGYDDYDRHNGKKSKNKKNKNRGGSIEFENFAFPGGEYNNEDGDSYDEENTGSYHCDGEGNWTSNDSSIDEYQTESPGARRLLDGYATTPTQNQTAPADDDDLIESAAFQQMPEPNEEQWVRGEENRNREHERQEEERCKKEEGDRELARLEEERELARMEEEDRRKKEEEERELARMEEEDRRKKEEEERELARLEEEERRKQEKEERELAMQAKEERRKKEKEERELARQAEEERRRQEKEERELARQAEEEQRKREKEEREQEERQEKEKRLNELETEFNSEVNALKQQIDSLADAKTKYEDLLAQNPEVKINDLRIENQEVIEDYEKFLSLQIELLGKEIEYYKSVLKETPENEQFSNDLDNAKDTLKEYKTELKTIKAKPFFLSVWLGGLLAFLKSLISKKRSEDDEYEEGVSEASQDETEMDSTENKKKSKKEPAHETDDSSSDSNSDCDDCQDQEDDQPCAGRDWKKITKWTGAVTIASSILFVVVYAGYLGYSNLGKGKNNGNKAVASASEKSGKATKSDKLKVDNSQNAVTAKNGGDKGEKTVASKSSPKTEKKSWFSKTLDKVAFWKKNDKSKAKDNKSEKQLAKKDLKTSKSGAPDKEETSSALTSADALKDVRNNTEDLFATASDTVASVVDDVDSLASETVDDIETKGSELIESTEDSLVAEVNEVDTTEGLIDGEEIVDASSVEYEDQGVTTGDENADLIAEEGTAADFIAEETTTTSTYPDSVPDIGDPNEVFGSDDVRTDDAYVTKNGSRGFPANRTGTTNAPSSLATTDATVPSTVGGADWGDDDSFSSRTLNDVAPSADQTSTLNDSWEPASSVADNILDSRNSRESNFSSSLGQGAGQDSYVVNDLTSSGPSSELEPLDEADSLDPSLSASNSLGTTLEDPNSLDPSLSASNSLGTTLEDPNSFDPSLSASNSLGASLEDPSSLDPSLSTSNSLGVTLDDSNALDTPSSISSSLETEFADSNSLDVANSNAQLDSLELDSFSSNELAQDSSNRQEESRLSLALNNQDLSTTALNDLTSNSTLESSLALGTEGLTPDETGSRVSDTLNSISGRISSTANEFSNRVDDFSSRANEVSMNLQNNLQNRLDSFNEGVNNGVEKIQEFSDQVANRINSTTEGLTGLSNSFNDSVTTVQDSVKNAYDSVTNAATNAYESTVGTIKNSREELRNSFDNVINTLGNGLDETSLGSTPNVAPLSTPVPSTLDSDLGTGLGSVDSISNSTLDPPVNESRLLESPQAPALSAVNNDVNNGAIQASSESVNLGNSVSRSTNDTADVTAIGAGALAAGVAVTSGRSAANERNIPQSDDLNVESAGKNNVMLNNSLNSVANAVSNNVVNDTNQTRGDFTIQPYRLNDNSNNMNHRLNNSEYGGVNSTGSNNFATGNTNNYRSSGDPNVVPYGARNNTLPVNDYEPNSNYVVNGPTGYFNNSGQGSNNNYYSGNLAANSYMPNGNFAGNQNSYATNNYGVNNSVPSNNMQNVNLNNPYNGTTSVNNGYNSQNSYNNGIGNTAPRYREYVTKEGDNLLTIAENELGSSSRWSEIKRLNNLRSGATYFEVGTRIKLPLSTPE